MSAPKLETQSATVPAQSDVNGPRKRRKRAPAAGAAADCFTCSTRSLKCDRRRPYCSQCLEDGKDCSGYKTQLTWGNGVASRGKLRGLSLPVAGTPQLPTPPSPSKTKRRQSFLQPPQPLQRPRVPLPPLGATNIAPPYSLSPDLTRGNGAFNFEHPLVSPTVPSPYSTATWPSPLATAPSVGSAIKVESANLAYSVAAVASVPLASPLDTFTFSQGLNTQAPYSANDRLSPMSYSTLSEEAAYFSRIRSHESMSVSNPTSSFPGSVQYVTSYSNDFPDTTQYPLIPGHVDSYDRSDTYLPIVQSHLLQTAVESRSGSAEEELVDQDPQMGQGQEESCAIIEDDPSVVLSRLSSNYRLSIAPFAGVGAIGTTPRMQYLINYYTEVISPVIVAFDGPSNPYRTKILQLAARSETLQHAIAALSASNLRQRKESGALSTGRTDPARRSSMAHLTLTNESWHNTGSLSPQEQAREESLHKGIAISSLNKQLAHPTLRKDDSILATLLVLCLFHICDSGVAKFQTQFAGVKKLLGLRKDDLRLDAQDTKWITRMFTWFDAMTATVNDREGQLQGTYVDICAWSDEEWALENLAGCDGQLFKTISQLGRLNVLGQGKSVEENPVVVPRPLPQMTPPPFSSNGDYSNFDGNGWIRIIEDEQLFYSKTDASTAGAGGEDTKTQFWREWREVRQALQTWHPDSSLFDTTSPAAPYLTMEQRFDLANISESFRYSALLYTERLANPLVPSTDQRIRSWVQHCLTYIKAVKSDVYLLWPLFITGSECVDEDDRGVIRERCLDIQKDSGFLNNRSCLELLEKVWLKYDADHGAGYSTGKTEEVIKAEENESGFRFTTIMKLENNEGEYIVV